MTKIKLYILSLVIMITSVVLILMWFDWKLLVVLILFLWANNLSELAEKS